MKKIIFIFLLLILIGCTEEVVIDDDLIPVISDSEEIIEINEEVVDEKIVSENPSISLECSEDTNCTGLERCIDNNCALLKEINPQECANKCTYKSATIETSDGQTLTLKRGESTYTAAGALAWKLLNPGEYCSGTDVRIPIEFEKVNYGKVLSTQVVTTKVGETSEEVTHPTVKRVKFTIKITDLVEECS
jgi:hypothetical protein